MFFKNKTILLPCDDPELSNFTKYFVANFDRFGIKKLISTSYTHSVGSKRLSLLEKNSDEYDPEKHNTKGKIFVLDRDNDNSGRIDIADLKSHYLEGNGDYRSKEVTKLRDEADIIITNPPFSLFRKFMKWIEPTKRHFLIIGRMTAVTYKEILPHFMNGDVWLGKNSGHFWFKVPDYYQPKKTDFKIDKKGQKWRRMGNICWFTNLDFKARHEDLLLYKHYNPSDYPKYDNYNAINVSAVKNIPLDYDGVMGVPTTFLAKRNPDQFELLGSSRYHDGNSEANDINFINGKGKFTRILIRRKHNEN